MFMEFTSKKAPQGAVLAAMPHVHEGVASSIPIHRFVIP